MIKSLKNVDPGVLCVGLVSLYGVTIILGAIIFGREVAIIIGIIGFIIAFNVNMDGPGGGYA